MTTLTQGLIQLSGQPLVHALGWTLLHFCWQGLAVAALLWCVLALLGGRSSQARYGVACLALGLMVALPAATFARVASEDLKARAASVGQGVVVDADLVLQVSPDEPAPSWTARVGAELDQALPWILVAWFAGVIVFVGRLNFGLMVARRLKTAGTDPVPAALLELFDELRIQLGVRRAVELVHSVRVQVPTVIGWLRPVVLLPASCLSGLSPEQIEAVLCHELAHVRRHDYLVSVIQSVIETVLFYHPAVWWVSKQVRRERECCCDELAVGVGGDVLAYARALSYLEESRAAFPEFVLGANGGVLTMRIKRILRAKGDVEGSPIAALVALFMIVALAGSYFIAVSRAQAQATTAKAAQTEIASAAAPVGSVSVSQTGTATVTASDPATDSLHGVYKAWLEQDVLWIITAEERAAFLRLTNDEERDDFIRTFWARRDQPGAAPNSFRQEHYARIAYSNEHFAGNTQVGWRSDRGHIYIVYGKPQSIDSHPSGGAVSAYPYEVWHYQYIAGIGDNVDVSFVDTCRCGQYNLTNQRLTSPGAAATLTNSQAGVTLVSKLTAQGGAAAPRTLTTSETGSRKWLEQDIRWVIPDAEAQQFKNSIASAAQTSAVAAAASKDNGSLTGSIFDPNGALVPRAKVTTVNTDDGTKRTVTTDNSGTYTFSLPPGPYILEVESPGFQRLLQENIHVKAGETVGLNIRLTVGAASESLTVKGSASAAAQPASQPQWAPPWNPTAPKPNGPQRVSSGVMAGLIISQPQPVYPEDAKAQHIQGTVVLRARIAKDGTIKNLSVVSGPPALMVSAIDSVRQWKYKPYLIDGEPVEVDTTVNINYTLGDSAPPVATEPQGAVASPDPLKRRLSDRNRSDGDVAAADSRSKLEGSYRVRILTRTISVAASDPDYPTIAKAAHVQGTVMLIGQLSQTGEVQDIKVMSGPPMLVQAAMDKAKQLKFDMSKATDSVPLAASISVRFVYDGAAPDSGTGPPGAAATSEPIQLEWNGVPLEKIGGSVTSPEVIYKVDPEFTEEARKAKFNGVVLVNLIVDQKGVPQNVHVLRGVGLGLDEKAVEAVSQYRFQPARKDGKPVSVGLNVEVDFQVFDKPVAAKAQPVTTPANASAAQRMKDGATMPVLIKQVEPEFSEEARKAKASGTVLVNLTVDKRGKPVNVHVIRMIGNGLDAKAIEAVQQYRFKPALKNNKPVAMPLNVEVNFQIF